MKGISLAKRKSPLTKILILIFISFFVEVFVFNYHYFWTMFAKAAPLDFTASDFSDLSGCSLTDGDLSVTGTTASFTINQINTPVYCLRISAGGSSTFKAVLKYTDDNFSAQLQNGGEIDYVPGFTGSNLAHLQTTGKCHSVSIQLQEVSSPVTIHLISVNRDYFHFQVIRFLILFGVLLLIFLIRYYRLIDVPFDFQKRWQQNLFSTIVFAGVCFIFLIYYGTGPFMFSFTSADFGNDCYRLLTDAFAHGSLSFRVTPSPDLLALANPYDKSVRDAGGVAYLWDSCFYHGKYYSYFGIGPVITLLLPFRLLTGVLMPTSFAVFLFTITAMFAVSSLYLKIIQKWFSQINVLTFASGLAVIIFGSNLFWTLARPEFYELAEISGICFMLLAFNCLIAALPQRKTALQDHSHRIRTFYLFLTGLFFGLMVSCRPNLLLYMIAAIPLLLSIFFADSKSELKRHLIAFLVPLSLFGAVIAVYNALRFGSIFNFGEKYNLTVNNVQLNSFSQIDKLFDGVFYYFFQPLNINLIFPFFHVISAKPSGTTVYMFNMPMAGIFNFPILLILPACVYILRRVPRSRRLSALFSGGILLSAFILITFNIFHAGAIMRYLMDIQLMLTFSALILWFELLSYFEKKGASRPVTRLFIAISIMTIVISSLLCLVGEDQLITSNHPLLFRQIAGLFQFWM